MGDGHQARLKHLRVGCATVLLLVLFSPVSCSAELSPDDRRVISALQEELAKVRADIAAAEAEDARLTGGLVKSLVAVRLELLRTNEALIQQRIHALESGARIKIVVAATKEDPERAAHEVLGEADAPGSARAGPRGFR